jgi:hypothetical protein
MAEPLIELPPYFYLVSGDNRQVPLPLWMARHIMDMVRRRTHYKTPCYAFEDQETEEELNELIKFTENNYEVQNL